MKEWLKRYGIKIMAFLGLFGVIALMSLQYYVNKCQSTAVIQSQYTFCAVVEDGLDLVETSRQWLDGYLRQMKNNMVPSAKAIKKYEITDVNVINANENIVLIGFWAEAVNKESDYFDSWAGYVTDGKMICKWVIKLHIEDMYDGTKSVCTTSVQMPEEYGIQTYVSEQVPGGQTSVVPEQKDLYRYQLVDGKIQVTFDGGNRWSTVPAESTYLLYSYETVDDNSDEQRRIIDEGRYVINSQCAYFLYGGVTLNGKRIPLTLVYSVNKGEEWVSVQISDLDDLRYGYINFFSEKDGVVVASFAKGQQPSSMVVYKTTDGGENWNQVGMVNSNRDVIAAMFINTDTGFVCYKQSQDYEDTLYSTFDGGKTFASVTLEEQTLSDNSDGRFTWKQVFSQATAPVMDANKRLVVNLEQDKDSQYVNKNMVAQYVSDDEGRTWKYLQQVDTTKK